MPDKPASNVKIYDRPEKKAPSPLLLVIGLLLVLLLGFFLYKAFAHSGAKPNASTGLFPVASSLLQERGVQ